MKAAQGRQWPCIVADNMEEVARNLEEFRPNMLLVDSKDPRLEGWLLSFQFRLWPIVFIDRHEGDVQECFTRLSTLYRQVHFPRLGLSIDGERQLAIVGETRLNLTLTELRLLRELAGFEDADVSREILERAVLGAENENKQALTVHICTLRKKLRPFGLTIESVRGVGYRLNPCPSDDALLMSADATSGQIQPKRR